MLNLRRYDGNPVLAPSDDRPWGKHQARNPGAIWDGKKVRMVYTAATRDPENQIMVLGYAESTDGFNFTTRDEPFMDTNEQSLDFDRGTLEDTRITEVEGKIYIAYAGRALKQKEFWMTKHDGWDPRLGPTWNRNYRRVGLSTTEDWVEVERLGPITSEEVSDANVALFPEKIGGKYAMLHRPTPFIPGQMSCYFTPAAIFLAYSDDLLDWKWGNELAHVPWLERQNHMPDTQPLIRPKFEWERLKIGAAGVPIPTDDGWLMLYHAVDLYGMYRVGLLLLDRANPRKVLARSSVPIFEPETEFETKGTYGQGRGCVFPCANLVMGDDVFIYYGAADKYTCLATAPLKEMLEYAHSCRVE